MRRTKAAQRGLQSFFDSTLSMSNMMNGQSMSNMMQAPGGGILGGER